MIIRYCFLLLTFILNINAIAQLAPPTQELPNILWLVCEDTSPALGAYDDPQANTPNIDRLAESGILYNRAFSNNPACAVARSTLITGVYATSMGTHNHRSKHPIPEYIKFFPEYLKQIGYYTTNNHKTDYNTSAENRINMDRTWNQSGRDAHYKNRENGQPFFAVFNMGVTHASSLFQDQEGHNNGIEDIKIPAYLPRIKEIEQEETQYYQGIKKMDDLVGSYLLELEQLGLSENTIVFFYSDHGGSLPRSKGYLYETGLRIPLIIYFPKKYQHLAPAEAGTKVNRMVCFADFAPSILNLLDIEIPSYMEGESFLGDDQSSPRKYVYSYKDRMDERYDVVRGVRSEKFFYRINYRPQKVYGQYLQFAWNSHAVRAWEAAYHRGDLNEVQSKFWKKRPLEELYSIEDDPENIVNLADNPEYGAILEKMRNAYLELLLKHMDGGLLPEPLIEEISKKTTVYEYMRANSISMKENLQKIYRMHLGDVELIKASMRSEDPLLAYWGIMTSMIYTEDMPEIDSLLQEIEKNNQHPSVRLALSEALFRKDRSEEAIRILIDLMKTKSTTTTTLYAMDIMEMMGEEARNALPRVKGLLMLDPTKASMYEFRAAAIQLLEKFSNTTPLIYWEWGR